MRAHRPSAAVLGHRPGGLSDSHGAETDPEVPLPGVVRRARRSAASGRCARRGGRAQSSRSRLRGRQVVAAAGRGLGAAAEPLQAGRPTSERAGCWPLSATSCPRAFPLYDLLTQKIWRKRL